jgi:hypothetical protein
VRNKVEKRISDNALARYSALAELRDEACSFKFADDGMISNWECRVTSYEGN